MQMGEREGAERKGGGEKIPRGGGKGRVPR